MRVGFDMISAGSGFAPGAGGMTTYYEGLSAGLVARPELDELIVFLPPWTDHAQLPEHPKLREVRCERLPSGRIGRVVYEHGRFAELVRRTGADVLLSTHNVKPLRWRGPSVVVLQSMQYFFLPDPIGAVRKAYLRMAVPRSLRSTDLVIAVSEAQRQKAIELFGLDEEQIITVHHGASPWATSAAERIVREGRPPRPPQVDPQRPYLVTVSSLYGLKNHRRLIEAFARAVAEHRLPHELVIAGREVDVTIAELQALATEHGVGDRVRLTGSFPQEDLPALLANADAIAYVSLFETFGHPVLEAFAFARPLLTANLGGAAEVAGEAAELADPHDVGDVARGLGVVLADERRRGELAAAGPRRLADFSWDRCAAETLEVLQRAIDRRSA